MNGSCIVYVLLDQVFPAVIEDVHNKDTVFIVYSANYQRVYQVTDFTYPHFYGG